MKNGNKILALSITSFQILCFVPIFQFPPLRARYRRFLAVLVTFGVNARWQLVRVLPFLSLVLMLTKDWYLIT